MSLVLSVVLVVLSVIPSGGSCYLRYQNKPSKVPKNAH